MSKNKKPQIQEASDESGEANAYTPGLKVKRSMHVQKLRRLPILGEVIVKVGDIVSFDQYVARTEVSGEPEIVKVAMMLSLDVEDVAKYLVKKVGDKVRKGEDLAYYSAVFGLVKKHVPSPRDGTVESFSEASGNAIIRGTPIPLQVNAYIPGKVIEVLPREGAIIETNAAFIQGIFGIGGETHGEIRIVVSSPSDELTDELITSDCRGKILVGGSRVTEEALKKAVELGVAAIVVGGIRHQDLTTFSGEEVGVAITGQEELGISLIITEGFGKMNMSETTFRLLKSFEGYTACLNGATQIRAGVLRPEIIIPHQEVIEEEGEGLVAGMVPGTPVRIIREPYFGLIGVVDSLPVELQALQSESFVRVLTVRLPDGGSVTVPRANVEIIEV
jgi:hypothetical protein